MAARIASQRAEAGAIRALMRINGVALPREFGHCEDEPFTTSAGFRWLFPSESGSDTFFVSLRDSKRAGDNDIKMLRAFASLGMLDLSNTSVTDACINDIAALDSLVWVDITGTAISEDGARLLQLRLPDCEVVVGEPTTHAN